jgi:hypothetical protein
MKTYNIFPISIFPITVLLCLTSCQSNDPEITKSVDRYQYSSDSFLPMAVGNYWRINHQNYTEITDTLLIEGVLYYEFYTLIGGDASLTEYLRIDNENNLIQRSPTNANWNYVKAKFNSSIGDTFFTLKDSSYNDLKVTTISKSENMIQFEYHMAYHPSLTNKHSVEYRRGLGPVENWKEVRIDGVIYQYN